MEWRTSWPALLLVVLIIVSIGVGVLIGFNTPSSAGSGGQNTITTAVSRTTAQTPTTKTSASTITTTPTPTPSPTPSTQPTPSGSFLIAFHGSSDYSDNPDNTDVITSPILISKPFWRVEYTCQPKIGSSLDFMIFAFAVFPGTSDHDTNDYVKDIGPVNSPTSGIAIIENTAGAYYLYVYSINCTWEIKVYE